MKTVKIILTLLILFVLLSVKALAQEDISAPRCDDTYYTSYDLTPPARVGSIAYDPNGDYLASGGTDEKIYVWCAKDPRLLDVLEGHEGDINSVAFSPDSRWIASGSDDGTVRLWEWDGATWEAAEDETKSFDRTLFGLVLNPFDNNVESVAFGSDDTTNPGSMLLACGTRGGKVALWRYGDSKKWISSIEIETKAPGRGQKSLEIDTKRAEVDTKLVRFKGHHSLDNVRVAFSPDGTLLAFGSGDWTYNQRGQSDNPVVLLNTRNSEIVSQLAGNRGEGITSLAFSRDGNSLASGGENDTITLWMRSNTGTFDSPQTIGTHHSDVKSVAFTPDGSLLVSASKDGTMGVWDIEGSEAELEGFHLSLNNMGWSVVNSIAFVPQDGLTVMACGSQDGVVRQRVLTETVDITGRFDLLPQEDLISDVAFAENATYFVLNPWFPNVTDETYTNSVRKLLEDQGINFPNITDVLRGKCTITLDINGFEETLEDVDPLENPLYFMYELKTPQERLIELEKDVQSSRLETFVAATISTAVGFGAGVIATVVAGPAAGTAVKFVANPAADASAGFITAIILNEIIMSGRRNRERTEILEATADPIFIFDGFARDFDRNIPRYLFMIQEPLTDIKINIQQTFRFNILTPTDWGLLPTYTVSSEGTWDLKNHTWITSEGMTLNLIDYKWRAPGAPSISLPDYPPFQELPADVQAYLLKYFGEFGTPREVTDWQIPEVTSLLPNYPNPFNPETWLPYQLSEPADVSLTIYDIQGRVVRDLDLGHQRAGMYHSRSRAAHWDGRNAQGEPVASGLYFYTLKAGEFTATRKMLIRK